MSQKPVYTLELFEHLFIFQQASLHWTCEVVPVGQKTSKFSEILTTAPSSQDCTHGNLRCFQAYIITEGM